MRQALKFDTPMQRARPLRTIVSSASSVSSSGVASSSAMQLVQIHVVGAEPLQRRIDCGKDVLGKSYRFCRGSRPIGEPRLRGHDELRALALQPSPNDPLRLAFLPEAGAERVHVGRVDEGFTPASAQASRMAKELPLRPPACRTSSCRGTGARPASRWGHRDPGMHGCASFIEVVLQDTTVDDRGIL